jgi:hypothetical protein
MCVDQGESVMAYVTVDVDVDLDEFDDDELVKELKWRGYHVQKDPFEHNKLDKFELDFLLDLVDKNNTDVYTNIVRDKIHKLRHR